MEERIEAEVADVAALEGGRARMEEGGRRRTVAINPALLVDGE